MILNKHESDGAIENLYNSSNIIASKYNIGSRKLAIIFNTGRQYLYHDVKKEDYDLFENAPSQGMILHSVIKKYKTERVADVEDMSPLYDQIKILKSSLNG